MSAAAALLGLKLDGGWTVVQGAVAHPGATGGTFSHGYIVEGVDGRKGYLKALDYSAAFATSDPARALQHLVDAFNFERDILAKCASKRLDRVVTAISDGRVDVGTPHSPPVVQYIIFELADGDVRRHVAAGGRFELAWQLRSLHHVATGLWQLHRQGIVHQDLKPSNVLVFGTNTSKISDLGCAASRESACPRDAFPIAGDRTYAPPEQLYNHLDPDWGTRRQSCDIYLLGSMLVFFVTGSPMTALLQSRLPLTQHWTAWTGTYIDVLPYLQAAFGDVLEQVRKALPRHLQAQLTEAVRYLCEPDFRLRGHPTTRAIGGNPYSLERFVGLFDLLASRER